MQRRQLEQLRERLLRAGVAPRHVHRYVRELGEHYEDSLRMELARGSNLATAEQSASARLGSEDDLARSVLAQPELRSTAARYPRLVFGVGPVVLWLASIVVTLWAIHQLSEAFPLQSPPAWMFAGAHALCIWYVRIMPAILGVVALTAAARRRLSIRWAVLGTAVVSVLAGTISVNVVTAPSVADTPQLGVSSSLVPFLFPFSEVLGKADAMALGVGLGRSAAIVAMSLVPYLVWHWRFSRHLDQLRS